MTVAREGSTSNGSSAIEILSAEIPGSNPADSDETFSLFAVLEWHEKPDTKERFPGPLFSLECDYPYPKNPKLDRNNICKLQKGDKVEFVEDSQSFIVKGNNKRDELLFLVDERNAGHFYSYDAVLSRTSLVVLPSYEERQSWLKRPIIEQTIPVIQNWDWELIYNLMIYLNIEELRILKAPKSYVAKCDQAASVMQSQILDCDIHALQETQNNNFQIFGYFVWKKREVEEKFENGRKTLFYRRNRKRNLDHLRKHFEEFYRNSSESSLVLSQKKGLTEILGASFCLLKKTLPAKHKDNENNVWIQDGKHNIDVSWIWKKWFVDGKEVLDV